MSDLFLRLLDLQQHILAAQRPIDTAFLAVNMVHVVLPYRQAVLWTADEGTVALSGAAVVESGAPYVLWLGQVMKSLAPLTAPRSLRAHDLGPDLAEAWADWLPEHAVLLPMAGDILLYAREDAFTEQETALLAHIAALVRTSRRALQPTTTLRERFRITDRRRAAFIAGGIFLVAIFPVSGSVLAPADAVPANPVMVRAPLEGVIDHVSVQPNAQVVMGQELFALDDTHLAGKLDVARQQWATADAEYRQAAQAMVFDAKAKVQAAILSGKVEESAAEVRLLESQLGRITVKSPRAGVAVFDDVSEWIGKPVVVGERVMAVADETDTEVEAWVSAADVGEARPGAPLTLFLNTLPLSPIRATVRSVAYEASARPDNTIAHRVRATLADGEAKPRLGLKGTARIDGAKVPLAWWLFRKPLGTIRQYLGF